MSHSSGDHSNNISLPKNAVETIISLSLQDPLPPDLTFIHGENSEAVSDRL